MASKFGTLAERLVGARAWFVPDGSNIGTVELPEITGPTAKPADDADWADYDLGRVTSAAYSPETEEREREWFSPEKGKYMKRNDEWVATDAFNLAMVDYASTLFDQLMFGLATAPVDNTAQPVFATGSRYVEGWVRLKRYNENDAGAVLCLVEFHCRLKIQTAPDDSSEPGSPIWRIEHLGDADSALEDFIANPIAA